MKRELLKGITMLVLLVTLGLAAASVSANAQPATKVVADVPFEFSVGYKTMPAGQYSVQTIASDSLLIRSADGKSSAVRLSEATERAKDKSQSRLVFHRYGDRYFLAQVWSGSNNIGRQLLKSQEEIAIENELTIASAASDKAHASDKTKALYETVEVLAVLR